MSMATSSLPYQPPGWLTVGRIALASAALAVVPWLTDARTAEGVALRMIGVFAPLLVTPLVAIVLWRRGRPSHDAPIRMLRDAGAWLVGTTLIVLPWRPLFVPAVTVGATTIAVAMAWLQLRRHFVARLRATVRNQPMPSAAISNEGAQPYLDEGLLPYQLGGDEAAYELLVWAPGAGNVGAYRDTAPTVAMALVPAPTRHR